MKSCAAVGVGVHVVVGAWMLASSLAACGAEPAAEPKTPEAVAVASTSDAPAVPEKPEAAEPGPEAEPAPAAAPSAPVAKDPNAPREVKYVVTPEGLKVVVAGVRFLVVAESKQVGKGWGARIKVKAESDDGKTHLLLNPKNGPIAFAAAVFKAGSTEAERIADAREGDAQLEVSASSPANFSREFPNKGGRILAQGETLDMEVALWGLGESKDEQRPVKQFVHVKMKVDKGKPRAIAEPPATAAK